MKTVDNQAGAAQGDNTTQAEADYGSLLEDSDNLAIEDPNLADELADGQDDPERDPEGEQEGEDKPDGQDAKGIQDEVTIKLDGRDVSVRELKETFTTFKRKTQEYAEAETTREVQARTAIANVQEEATQRIVALAQGINDLVLPGIDMQAIARLRLEDPDQAGRLLANLQIVERWKTDMMTKANELWQSSQAQRKQAADKQNQAQLTLVQAEAEKLSGAKWFNDDFKIKAKSFLKSHGIPESFAGQIPYAGGMEVIRKAMLYDKAQAELKRGKQPSQQAQVSASAKPRDANTRQRADAAFAQARKTGSRRDTARAYTSLLGGG